MSTNSTPIKAYFSDLEESEEIKTNFNPKTNCIIEHDKFSLNFLSNYGESFNVTLKNEIIKIFPITNGIIIKVKDLNSDFSFFKSNENENKEKIQYKYYYLTNHPLSSLVLLNYSTKNFDIIKTSINFPFIIIKTKKDIKLCLILINKIFNLKNFKDNIDKLVNAKNNNISTNNFNDSLSSDYTFKLIDLYTFKNIQAENINSIKKIKFYKNASHKTYLYIAFQILEKLIIYKIKFGSEYTIKKVDFIEFNKVIEFYLVDSLLNTSNELLFSFKKNSNMNNTNLNITNSKMNFDYSYDINTTFNNNNSSMNNNDNNYKIINPIKFLLKYNIYTSNSTLIYLEKDSNNLIFIEDLCVLITHNLNLEEKIKHFEINPPNSYLVFNKEKNIFGQINLYFNLNEKNVILNILKYIRYEYGENIYYSLLQLLFKEIHVVSKKNHLDIFNNIIFNLFSTAYGKNNIKYENFYFNNDKRTKLENNIFNSDVINEIKKYNINEAISSFVYFLKGLYENIKLYNYYEESISIKYIINLLFNLLKISDDENLVYQYLLFFNNYYNLSILFNLGLKYPINFTNISPIVSYLDNLDQINQEKYIFNHIYNFSQIISDIKNTQENPLMNTNTRKRSTLNYLGEDSLSEYNNNTNQDQYIIFSKYSTKNKYKNQKYFSSNNSSKNNFNFLFQLINFGYNNATLKNVYIKTKIPILNEITKAKYTPYIYIQALPHFLKSQILSLIDREDLGKNILIPLKTKKKSQIENISSMLYHNYSSDYNREYYLTKIKFNQDNRIEEVNRLLSPTRILKIESSVLKNIEDLNQLEQDKFILVYKNLIKQYTSCIGNGALNLNTIKTFPKETLIITPLNTQCLLTSEETTYKFNKNSDFLGDKDFSDWPQFHNGVAQSLKLSTENFNNKSYIRNWILFNKPDKANFEHGGFLLGMGLLKQLDSLYATDVYQYMKTTHEGVTIGILLGKSASKLGSMEETLSRTLCLHISFLIPTSLEISIPMNIQCSAVIGIGLLYLKSDNRLMTEMLINQIGKISNNNDKGFDLKHLNSYNLSLGFAIGLINLGHGKINSKHENNYEDKIFSMIYLNDNKSLINDKTFLDNNGNSILNNQGNNNNTNQNNKMININQTTPAGFACLTLYYLQTKNNNILSRIKTPENLYQLDSFKPFHLYLAILCKNLISWDNITSSINWVKENIPNFIQFLHESSLADISDDINYNSKLNLIDFSQISTCYFYSLSAGLMSLGFKYCGTNNNDVCKIIIYYIKNVLLKASVVNDIIIRENVKFEETNKRSISKKNLDECLCISAYALSLVMSGSGNLDCLKILKIIRKKVSGGVSGEGDFKNFYAGFVTSINHAIGILFLGNGGLILNRNINSLAFLYIATFPVFNKTLNDNDRYLQPLRHLYVLACENKLFETRDVDTNNIIQTKINVEYLNGSVIELLTPINLENFDFVKRIYMKNNENYLDMEINREDIDFTYWNNKSNLMKTKIGYIKKKEISNTTLKLIISQIDINNTNLAINKITEAINILKNTPKIIFGNLSKICIEEIEYILNNLQQENNFDLLFIKCVLLLLIDKYHSNENQNLFFLINDKLLKVRNSIKNGKSEDFELFDFFINITPLLLIDNENIPLKVTFDTIKDFIIRGLNESYKNNLKNFILNFSFGKLNEFPIDWNLMKYIHLFRINIKDFCDIVKFIIYNMKEKNNIINDILENKDFVEIINEDNLNFVIYVEKLIKEMK